jgi:hypothetical protein
LLEVVKQKWEENEKKRNKEKKKKGGWIHEEEASWDMGPRHKHVDHCVTIGWIHPTWSNGPLFGASKFDSQLSLLKK